MVVAPLTVVTTRHHHQITLVIRPPLLLHSKIHAMDTVVVEEELLRPLRVPHHTRLQVQVPLSSWYHLAVASKLPIDIHQSQHQRQILMPPCKDECLLEVAHKALLLKNWLLVTTTHLLTTDSLSSLRVNHKVVLQHLKDMNIRLHNSLEAIRNNSKGLLHKVHHKVHHKLSKIRTIRSHLRLHHSSLRQILTHSHLHKPVMGILHISLVTHHPRRRVLRPAQPHQPKDTCPIDLLDKHQVHRQ